MAPGRRRLVPRVLRRPDRRPARHHDHLVADAAEHRRPRRQPGRLRDRRRRRSGSSRAARARSTAGRCAFAQARHDDGPADRVGRSPARSRPPSTGRPTGRLASAERRRFSRTSTSSTLEVLDYRSAGDLRLRGHGRRRRTARSGWPTSATTGSCAACRAPRPRPPGPSSTSRSGRLNPAQIEFDEPGMALDRASARRDRMDRFDPATGTMLQLRASPTPIHFDIFQGRVYITSIADRPPRSR